jgi:nitrogen fixation protein FixH
MSLSESRPSFVLKGWHVLVAILLFFAADIAVNAYFMVIAYKTFPGETSVTPYEDGIAYNSALKQMRDQKALGWRITAGAVEGGQLQVQAFDHAGAPLNGLRVSAELLRPATETGRRTIAMAESAPGVYTASTSALDGAWDMNVTLLDAQGHKAIADRRVVLP